MDLGVFDYALDPALIAQHPLSTRDGSRLMVVPRHGETWAHAGIRDIGRWLDPGDVMVFNDAEVIAARLRGRRPSGGAVEVLLVEPLDAEGTWCCIARGAGRIPPGETAYFSDELVGIWGDRGSDVYRTIRLRCEGDLAAAIARCGEIPLPPYIRRPAGPSELDRERYQTIFARHPGAIAAPTAGLHFTRELIEALVRQGVRCTTLTLLVGPATFLPVRDASLATHVVPPERYEIPGATAAAIATAQQSGRRVIAVGTTSVRALESAALEDGTVHAGAGRTDLLIAPGHRFCVVDALLTNFHLPRSSLMALVAAFAGTETTLAAYRAAAAAGYRFYSFGDAMLITP